MSLIVFHTAWKLTNYSTFPLSEKLPTSSALSFVALRGKMMLANFLLPITMHANSFFFLFWLFSVLFVYSSRVLKFLLCKPGFLQNLSYLWVFT